MSQSLRRWLVPDIALVLVAITMLYCMAQFSGMQFLFRDSDSGWHIRNGEQILASGKVPTAEPFSFSKPGAPWFAWEWLADCMMAKAHIADGMTGVFFLYLFVIGLVSWLWFQLLWTTKSVFLIGAASTSIMLTMCNIHWLARPHLMGWVFLLLAVLAAEHAPSHLDFRYLTAIFLMGVLWANIHGSFFLGTAIFFLYGAEKWLRQDTVWITLAAAGILALVSSFVNPYGWHVHEHIIEYLRDEELLARVGEFQSFNFHLEGAMPLVIGMAVVGAGISLNAVQGNYARAILCLVLFAGALRSARGIPLVALIGMPLAIGAISRELEKLPRLAAFITYNNNLRKMDSCLRGWALMPALLLALFLVAHAPIFAKPPGFAEELFPVKVSSAVEKLPLDVRLFSTDKFGGYLIYRFAGQRKVFFDGRSDFYGAEFMKEYLLMPDLRPGWEKPFNRWSFTHALVPKDAPLAEMLALKGWKQIGQDTTAILFEKGPR